MSGANIQIEAVSGKRGRRRFVRCQFDLYSGDPNWVPPLIRDEIATLDPASNPGLRSGAPMLWLAMRDGNCVGRIAGIINARDNALRGAKAARFSLVDFIDDPEVSRSLVGTVERWALENGMERLEGPLGVTTFERSAVLVDGFDRLPTAVSSYNFSYYGKHFEALGFQKQIDYVEHRFRIPAELDPKYEKIASYVLEKKRLKRFEKRSRKELLPHGEEIFRLINQAYAELYEFMPLTGDESDALIKKFFAFIDPSFVKMVVDADGKIVAAGIAMPSVSLGLQAARGKLWPLGLLRFLRAQKKNDTLDLCLVAVKPELRNAGLPAILMHEMHKQAVAAKLQWAESNGELETNLRVLSMWKDIEHETHKRRRIYAKLIGS